MISKVYTISDTVRGLLKEISANDRIGNVEPRGLKVKESLLTTMPIDPVFPFPNYRNRQFNFKYFTGELAWYLRKDNNVDYISDYSGFWKHITNPGTNEINSNYGSLLFGEQLDWAVRTLKADKESRQAIAFLNEPKFQFNGNKDFVCTMYLNFFIRRNQLHMKVQMRSNDVFYGLTFDAPFFSFVQQHMYLWLKETYPDLELGTYYHMSDNSHFYERHFDLAEKIINENTSDNEEYQMKIPNALFTVHGGEIQLTSTGRYFVKQVESFNPTKNDSMFYLNLLSPFLGIKRIEAPVEHENSNA